MTTIRDLHKIAQGNGTDTLVNLRMHLERLKGHPRLTVLLKAMDGEIPGIAKWDAATIEGFIEVLDFLSQMPAEVQAVATTMYDALLILSGNKSLRITGDDDPLGLETDKTLRLLSQKIG